MIDVHLIGYTADLQHLVLDLDGGADGRYRVLVDADLFATLDELREERRAAGLPVGDLSEFLDEEELEALERGGSPEDGAFGLPGDLDEDDDEQPDLLGEVERDRLGTRDTDRSDADDDDPSDEVISHTVRLVSREPDPEPGPEATAERAPDPEVADHVELDPEPEHADEAPPVAARFQDASQPSRRPATAGETPKLSPAQIQAMLRAGKSPRTVARDAGTDIAWIERWLPPILAERTRILERAHAKSLNRPRLGTSRDPLGRAVERNLKARGIDDELTWDVGRRNDGRWKVSVRFAQRGRNRTATWTYDPSDDELRAASELARELGFTRTKRSSAGSKSATKKSATKKSATKKSATKGSPARTSGARSAGSQKATPVAPSGAEAPTGAPSGSRDGEPATGSGARRASSSADDR